MVGDAGERGSVFLQNVTSRNTEFNSNQVAHRPVGRLGDWTAETATAAPYTARGSGVQTKRPGSRVLNAFFCVCPVKGPQIAYRPDGCLEIGAQGGPTSYSIPPTMFVGGGGFPFDVWPAGRAYTAAGCRTTPGMLWGCSHMPRVGSWTPLVGAAPWPWQPPYLL